LYFQADPFLRRVNGSAEFEGFIVDLVKMVFRLIAADYEISLVEDGKYGGRRADGWWNGMIGQLVTGVSDIRD